jgi:hypothetical protein
MRDAAPYCEIGAGVAAVGSEMWMYGPGASELKVTGGSLTLPSLRIAVDGGPKTVSVTAGSINLSSDSTIGQSAQGYLNINGGSFTNTGWTFFGHAGGSGNATLDSGSASFGALRMYNGEMTVNGGTMAITAGDWTVGEGGKSFNMTINGGVVDQTAGWMYVAFGGAGGVHLNGGMLSVNSLQLDGSAGEYFDIAGGTLKIKDARPADIAYQINWYAGNGWITAYGQNAVGKLNITSDQNGYTIVTAVPEPITMVLLGIGGLFLRRK